jgi:type VI secretion system secreted protein VgrG
VRVSQTWAGAGWGFIQIPRIGQEVIVEFLEGDPDRPIITGRVYNASCMPPYDLPSDATQSGIKSNSSKGGGGWNELRFEDKKGEEEVYIQAEKDENDEKMKDAEKVIQPIFKTGHFPGNPFADNTDNISHSIYYI